MLLVLTTHQITVNRALGHQSISGIMGDFKFVFIHPQLPSIDTFYSVLKW